MSLPRVNIVFQSKAIKAMQRGAVGICAIVLKDPSVTSVKEYKLQDVTDIPEGLSATNQEYLEHALSGTPKEVKAVVIHDDAANYNDALNYLEAIKFNIMAIPGILQGDVDNIASWVKSMWDNKGRKIFAVLPHIVADHEAVINSSTDDIVIGEKIYSASEYTARIAGVFAGLPLTVAPTYYVLPEIDDVPKLTKDEAGDLISAGKLILYHDGEKVKIARGVTSLTTTTEEKGADWKKFKLARIYAMVYHDVKDTIEDEYIGKVQNSYENKLLLTTAVNAYYEMLELERVLDSGKNRCDINLAAQKVYLKSIGYTTVDGRSVDDMSEQEIKEANTRDKVFISGPVRGLDAIEDVDMVVNL